MAGGHGGMSDALNRPQSLTAQGAAIPRWGSRALSARNPHGTDALSGEALRVAGAAADVTGQAARYS